MTNTTRRITASLVALAVLGLLVAVLLPNKQSSTEVVTGDESTTTQATVPATTTTTEVPETTTAASTTTTVVPATTVVETTTTPPVAEPTDTSPSVPASVATTSPPLQAQEDVPQGGVQPVGAGDPAPAARVATGVCTTDAEYCNPPTTPARAEWAYCEEWHELAAEVGWPESQGRTLSYVMHRESRCDPNAYNRSGATGLMQLLGWRCDGGCFNPRGNLAKALELWQSSGWCPWVLRGDPVTGRACG